ncbi:YecA family protein [Cohnella zeiphila]|uniref:SEC-C domain-containing protein n=1 Tax=Cohnella zeiphila TaxID=2761120 RepID=A0A7X0VW06_9BACL|nr:SEC-C metal-binding domain-containing protein [Cohnella zeiphila]MBB6732669.1 SEC-C domain-containing protein [Cohnella zeiphila]
MEMDEKIREIYDFCENVNMIEFLSYSAVLSWISFGTRNEYSYMSPIDFEYLVGVFLSLGFDKSKKGKGSIQENGRILENLKKLIPLWKLSNNIRKVDGKTDISDINKALFEANYISATATIKGYSHYQPKDKFNSAIFKPYSNTFKASIGFDFDEALKFLDIINEHYKKILEQIRNDLDSMIGTVEHLNDEYLGMRLFEEMHAYKFNETLFFNEETIEMNSPDIDRVSFRSFLEFFSVDITQIKLNNIKYFNDTNPFKEKPILYLDNKFFLINPMTIRWCMKDRFEDELKRNQKKWQSYNAYKSDCLEDLTMKLFKKIFPSAEIYSSLYYISKEGKRCELDGLVKYDNCIILIEAKSGIFSKSARNGAIGRLENVLYDNIDYAAMQANRAKEYITLTHEPIFEDKSKKEIFRLKKNGYENIYLLNVTSEYFSELSTNLKQLHNIGLVNIENFPWSVTYTDLDIIADFTQFPNQFLHYIYFREKLNNKAQISGTFKHMYELDLFGFYLLEETEGLDDFFTEDMDESVLVRNIYLNKSEDARLTTPDFSSIFNEYYNRKAINIESHKIKKKYNTEYYHLVRQIEKYENQSGGFSNLVLRLLDFNNSVQDQIIALIHSLNRETSVSKQIKVKSLPYLHGNFDEKPNFGITIISAYQKDQEKVFELLKNLIVINRSKYNYTEWLGLCSFIDNKIHLVNNFMFVRDDKQLDSIWGNLSENLPSKKLKYYDGSKLSRNDPCPCGSGKKYKKCCLGTP